MQRCRAEAIWAKSNDAVMQRCMCARGLLARANAYVWQARASASVFENVNLPFIR
jgi:hypothetical protein